MMLKSKRTGVNSPYALIERYFSSGWIPFVPYMAAYLAFWQADAPLNILLILFRGLHLLHGVGLAFCLVRWTAASAVGALPFMVALGIIFVIPGAFFEYGSDVWAHYERIIHFAQADSVREALRPDRFAYLFSWSLIYGLDPNAWRSSMVFCGAFWNVVLAYQYLRLMRVIGFGEGESRLQVFGIIVFSGILHIAYFRYYALSSTPLAQVGYLAVLVSLIEFLKRPGLAPLAAMGGGLLVTAGNHLQSVLFLGATGPALLFSHVWMRHPFFRKRLVASFVTLWLAGLAGGFLFMTQVEPTLGQNPRNALSYLSAIGTYPVWDPELYAVGNAGLWGFIGIAGAFLFFRKWPQAAALTISPVFILLFPPIFIPFQLFLGKYDTSAITLTFAAHRWFFAFPSSVGLVMLIGAFVGSLDLHANKVRLTWGFVLISLAALVTAKPFYGRLWNVLHRPPAVSAANFPETREWLLLNRPAPGWRQLLTDRYSSVAVFRELPGYGAEVNFSKLDFPFMWPQYEDLGDLDQQLRDWRKSKQALLLVAPGFRIPPELSPLAFINPHHANGEAILHLYGNQAFARSVMLLVGPPEWEITPIPPFYLLVEPIPEGLAQ